MWDVSLFRGQKDNEPHQNVWELDQLGEFLLRRRARPAEKAYLGLWSPTLYLAESTRAKAAVVSISCVVLDYDSGTTIEAAFDCWDGYTFFLHTSWRHTPEHHKFRLVLPLAASVPGAHWRAVWDWAFQRSGCASDASCKDQSRMYYLSCDGADARFIRQDGALLDLSHVKPKPRLTFPRREMASRKPSSTDPAYRQWVADKMGAKMGDNIARGVKCPGCQRPTVWWPIVPDTSSFARCNHSGQSCGWYGPIDSFGV